MTKANNGIPGDALSIGRNDARYKPYSTVPNLLNHQSILAYTSFPSHGQVITKLNLPCLL